jgi:hypothetical protein
MDILDFVIPTLPSLSRESSVTDETFGLEATFYEPPYVAPEPQFDEAFPAELIEIESDAFCPT